MSSVRFIATSGLSTVHTRKTADVVTARRITDSPDEPSEAANSIDRLTSDESEIRRMYGASQCRVRVTMPRWKRGIVSNPVGHCSRVVVLRFRAKRPSHLHSLGHRPRYVVLNVFQGPKGRQFVTIATDWPFGTSGYGVNLPGPIAGARRSNGSMGLTPCDSPNGSTRQRCTR